jgi:hypothetical protein
MHSKHFCYRFVAFGDAFAQSRADGRSSSEKTRASSRSLQAHHLHTGSDTITEQFMETVQASSSWSASAESHLSQHSDLDSLEVHL